MDYLYKQNFLLYGVYKAQYLQSIYCVSPSSLFIAYFFGFWLFSGFLFGDTHLKKGIIMKYEFIKIDDDVTELRYKDKVFKIKKDIDLQVKIQSAIPRARILMSAELSKMGITKKDLVIERHEGNKTYYDNSNVLDIEEQYQAIASQQVYDEIISKYCDMTLAELMQDIGLNVEEANIENEKFGLELTSALMGREIKSPSEQKGKDTK